MGYIVLGALAIALTYLGARSVVIYNFRNKHEDFTDQELKDLKQKMYWNLDDYDWGWRERVEYETVLKMLKERGF